MRPALIPSLILALCACVTPTPDTPDGGDETPDAAVSPDAGEPDAGLDAVPAGDFSGRYTDPRGRRGRYVGWVPEGLVHPGALVFLHADDGGDAYGEWIDATTRGLATTYGLIVISLQEPENGCWWAPRGEDDARFLGDLVADELVRKRQVDASRVVLVGKSGGAFLAAGVPALLGFPWGGAVVALCGGDVPRHNGGNCDDDTDAPAADVALHSEAAPRLQYWFATTTRDDYRQYSVDAAAALRNAGAEVVFRNVGTGGHCEFDLLAELATALETMKP